MRLVWGRVPLQIKSAISAHAWRLSGPPEVEARLLKMQSDAAEISALRRSPGDGRTPDRRPGDSLMLARKAAS